MKGDKIGVGKGAVPRGLKKMNDEKTQKGPFYRDSRRSSEKRFFNRLKFVKFNEKKK